MPKRGSCKEWKLAKSLVADVSLIGRDWLRFGSGCRGTGGNRDGRKIFGITSCSEGGSMSIKSEGTWGPNDPRRVFVEGAAWWEFHSKGATMWQADRRIAENEAERRYPQQEDSSAMCVCDEPECNCSHRGTIKGLCMFKHDD